MGGNNNEESRDFYQVLGLKKGCSDAELKNAYKKLALRWHPDRCSAFGNSKHVDDANNKFQTIQEAYSVLSNANKRFLYDVGVYDSDDDDDDDQSGMADFLNEMAVMMSENKPAADENGQETFEQLKDLFQEMFQSDIIIDSLSSSSQTASSSSLFSSSGESSTSNKRGPSNTKATGEAHFRGFCIGTGGGLSPAAGSRGRKNARKGSSRKQQGYRC